MSTETYERQSHATARAEVSAVELRDNYLQFVKGQREDFVAHFAFIGVGCDLEYHEETYLRLLMSIDASYNIDESHWHTPEGVVIEEECIAYSAGNVGHVVLRAAMPDSSPAQLPHGLPII